MIVTVKENSVGSFAKVFMVDDRLNILSGEGLVDNKDCFVRTRVVDVF